MKKLLEILTMKRQVTFANHWHRLFTIAGIISAADSVYVLFFPMQQQFLGSFGSLFAANMVAMVVIAAYLYIVDASLMKFLPGTIAGLITIGTQGKNKGALIVGTLIFCLIQTYATIYVSKTLRHSAVAIVSEKPKTVDIAALTSDANAAQKERITAADKEIERVKNEKQSALSSIPKKAAKMAAWGKGGSYEERIKNFKSQEKENERDFQAKKRNMAGGFDSQLQKAADVKAGILNDPTLTASIAAADKVNSFEIETYQTKTTSFADFLLRISLYSTGILWFAGIMIGFAAAAGGIGLVPSLLGETNTTQKYGFGGLSVAQSIPSDINPRLVQSTIAQTAAHEAGHFCAYAYLVAEVENGEIEIDKISTLINAETGTFGHVSVVGGDIELTPQNIQLALLALTAGYAAEFFAYGHKSYPTPLAYLKAIGYAQSEGSDFAAFQKTCSESGASHDFLTVYKEAVSFFIKDNAMLQRVTSELMAQREITGEAVRHLWNETVNWYRVRGGKQPIKAKVTTSSVVDPKTPEKTVITENQAELKPIFQISYHRLTAPQLRVIETQLSSDYTKLAWQRVLTHIGPLCFIYENGHIIIEANDYEKCILELKRTYATVTPIDPIVSTDFCALFESDRKIIIEKHLIDDLTFGFLENAFITVNPVILVKSGVWEVKDVQLVIERAKKNQKRFFFEKEMAEKEALAAELAKQQEMPVIAVMTEPAHAPTVNTIPQLETVTTAKTPVITVSKPVELEITTSSSEQWLSNLKAIELEGETYTPSEIITAKTCVITYWSRSFTSKSEAKKAENREKALKFKRVLEMTGLTVELYDNGKGKVTI